MTQPTPPLDLDALTALVDAATRGPWAVGIRWQDDNLVDYLPINTPGTDPDDPHQPDRVALIRYHTGGFQFPHHEARADAEFIAAARTALPALIRELADERTYHQRTLATLAQAVAEVERLTRLLGVADETGDAELQRIAEKTGKPIEAIRADAHAIAERIAAGIAAELGVNLDGESPAPTGGDPR